MIFSLISIIITIAVFFFFFFPLRTPPTIIDLKDGQADINGTKIFLRKNILVIKSSKKVTVEKQKLLENGSVSVTINRKRFIFK